MLDKVRVDDPRVRRTRQLLRDALMDLLLEKSFQTISVQDITERATVNRATFYAHYVDKHALLTDLIREVFQQRLAQYLTADAPLSAENLRKLVEAVCGFIAELYRRCSSSKASQFEPLVEEEVKRHVTERLRGWLKTPKGGKNADSAEVTATITSWAIYGAAQQWSRMGKRMALSDYVEQVMPMIMAGMNTGLNKG